MTQPGRKRKLSEWEPVQVASGPTPSVDLRDLASMAPRGYKLKPVKTGTRTLQKVQAALAAPEEPAAMEEDEQQAAWAAPAVKRQRAEGVAYRNVSGKSWKGEAEKRASADKNAVLGSSWDKKMRDKALRKAFQEQKSAAVEAAREKRKAAAKHRAAVKERKKANQEKSAQVQKITNAATLKKMMKSKKQRKMLRTADTTS